MGKTTSAITMICAAAILFGCAAQYRVPDGTPTAKIRLLGENSSTGTFSKRFFLLAFENENCETLATGTTLVRLNSSGKNRAMSESVAIKAGKPATITAQYIDARFAQNRSCYATGTFTPTENEDYTVVLAVNPEVTECRLGVFRGKPSKTTRVNSLHIPAAACTTDGKYEGRNGKPLWMNWVFY